MQEIDPIDYIIPRLVTMGYTLEQIGEMNIVDALELIIIDNDLESTE